MSSGGPTPSAVRFEHHRASLGIGDATPRLSWRVEQAPDGWWQIGYEVEVADEAGGVLTSARVDSSESVLVPWPGTPAPVSASGPAALAPGDQPDRPHRMTTPSGGRVAVRRCEGHHGD